MVETLYQNLIKATPAFARRDDENEREHEGRVIAAIARRWGVTAVTLRSWRNGNRRPRPDRKKFFADLREFGGIRLTPTGGVIPASIGDGPSMEDFVHKTRSGYKPELYKARRDGAGNGEAKPNRARKAARKIARAARKAIKVVTSRAAAAG